MNHLRRAAGATAAAALALGIAVPAQAAAPTADRAPQWSIKLDRLEGTPSSYDRLSVWSGTCPVPGSYGGYAGKVTPSWKYLGDFEDLECEGDHTFTLSFMIYDYARGRDLPKGTKVAFEISVGRGSDDDDAVAAGSPDGPLYATV
ncbi:hypothetical protein ACIPLC_38080 [Kitasatospora sp. NPDC086801]|uniref:hypothetical protein n=1 Tax=Kitasatospora sp. NPDC086801 TaxID=3364066 RepID=UPI00380F8114